MNMTRGLGRRTLAPEANIKAAPPIGAVIITRCCFFACRRADRACQIIQCQRPQCLGDAGRSALDSKDHAAFGQLPIVFSRWHRPLRTAA
jgi:hypothetical protein